MLWLLAISLSIDALAVSVAYGLKATRIPILSKLVICVISILYFGIAIWLGALISEFFHPETARILGIVLMSIICLWMLLQVLLSRSSADDESGDIPEKTLIEFSIKSVGLTFKLIRDPMLCDIDRSKSISPVEAIFLGTALSIDAFSIGLGYSLSGEINAFTPLAVGLCQLLFLWFGNWAGLKFRSTKLKISNKLQIVSVIIIFLLILVRIFG